MIVLFPFSLSTTCEISTSCTRGPAEPPLALAAESVAIPSHFSGWSLIHAELAWFIWAPLGRTRCCGMSRLGAGELSFHVRPAAREHAETVCTVDGLAEGHRWWRRLSVRIWADMGWAHTTRSMERRGISGCRRIDCHARRRYHIIRSRSMDELVRC